MADAPAIFLCQVCDQTPERGHAPDCPGWLTMTEEQRTCAEQRELLERQREVAEVACESAQRTGAIVTAQRDKLREALIGLVGASEQDELDAMEAVIRATPAAAEDKAALLDAIHALKERA